MSENDEMKYIRNFTFGDRNHLLIVKGLAVAAALVAYLCKEFWSYPHLMVLRQVAVSVFLLCSGYGVSESNWKKSGMPHYWENKVIRVWIPSLLVLMVGMLIEGGSIISWVPQYPVALKENLLYLIFGNYLAFWLLFTFAEKKSQRLAGLFVLAAIAFFFVGDRSLQRQLFCFPIGVTVSQLGWKRKIRSFHWGKSLLIALAGGAAAVGGWFLTGTIRVLYVTELVWSITFLGGAVFLIMGVYAARAIPVFGIFAPFGYMAYILFLVHKEIIRLAQGQSDWRVAVGILVALLVGSLLVSWLHEQLMKWNKKMRRRKKPHLKGSMW